MTVVEESFKVTMAVLIAYNGVSRIMEAGGMYLRMCSVWYFNRVIL